MAGSRVTQTRVSSLIVVILSMVALMATVGKQGVMGQSSCTSVLSSLSPCLNYIMGTQTNPPKGCCDALASVVKNNAPCLCQLVTGNNSLGIAINQTRALALPDLCKVSPPPVSLCKGISPTAPSGNGSGNPTTETPPSSNPTHNNSASRTFVSTVLNVVTAVVLTAIVM